MNYYIGTGGALQIVYSKVYISNCVFSNNKGRNGGAIFTVLSNITISDCIFYSNQALMRSEDGGNGGAIFFGLSTNAIILKSIFKNNMAITGGVIVQSNSELRVEDTVFAYNQASNGGVFLIFNDSKIESTRCSFYANYANISAIANIQNSFAFQKSCLYQENMASAMGGVFSLVDRTILFVTLSIFNDNYAPSSLIVENHGSGLAMFTNCEFTFSDNFKRQIIQSLFSISNYNFLLLKDSRVSNSKGNVIWCTSNAIIVVYNTTFYNVSSKVINIHSQGYFFSISTTFIECKAEDYLVVLRNGARGILFRNNFIDNNGILMVFTTYNSSMIIIESKFFNNIVRNELIAVRNEYTLQIYNSIFKNNIGKTRGCIISVDQLGKLTSTNNYFINNTSVYGTIINFVKKRFNYWHTDFQCFSTFKNDTIVNNTALVSGAIVYYRDKIIGTKYTCESCLFLNNIAHFGNNINSGFHSFSVIQASKVHSNEHFPALIYAFDQFDNLIRGKNDIRFHVSSCDDIHLTGVTSSTIQLNGVTALYNLKVNSPENHFCNLSYKSNPKKGDVKLPISILNCPQGEEMFDVSYQGKVFQCLKTIETSNIAKTVMIITTSILVLLILLCFGITIAYSKEKVINFGNIVFLILMLFSCLFLCIIIYVSIEPTNFSCQFSAIVFPIGIGILFTLTLLKQYKIYKLFKYSDFLKINTDNLKMVKYAGLIMVPVFLLVLIGVIVYPSKPTFILDLHTKTATKYCISRKYYVFSIVIVVYEVIILLTSCFIAMKSKRYHSTPGTFYESLFNSILIYNYTLVFIVLIPLFYTLQNNPTTIYLIYSIGSSILVFATLSIIFIPKINFLFRRKQIVSTLKKTIETQERDIQRNKDLLIFYKMFLIEKKNNNFNNNPIFNIHETFSSEDENEDEEDDIGEGIYSLFNHWDQNKRKYNNNQIYPNQIPKQTTNSPSSQSIDFSKENNIDDLYINPTIPKNKSINNSPNLFKKTKKKIKI